MNLLFLGTGAADWPTEPPRPDFGPGEWRAFTATLVADAILIDCGPTTTGALDRFGVDPASITDLLVTHGHGDHYSLDAIAKVAAAGGLRVHADPVLVPELNAIPGVQASPLAFGAAFFAGALEVTPVPGNHTLDRPGELAYHFLLCDGQVRLFYATDGAWLSSQTWRALRAAPVDGAIWEATCGDTADDWRLFEHSSAEMVRMQRDSLVKQKAFAATGPVWLTHLARTLCSPHPALSAALAPQGLTVAHDGLRTCLEGRSGARP